MLGYAEIHYRPSFITGFLARPEPEMIFDVPRRVDPGKAIPVGLIIKDAHRFPVDIGSVIIHMVYQDSTERAARFPFYQRVDVPLWWDVFNIVPEQSGWVRITPYLEYSIKGKRRTVVVDSYKNLSHAPFKVYASEDALPGKDNWYHGDIHCHSEYTEDQVEFGAPVGFTAMAAKSMGLDWIALTDHSYDLDDKPGFWTEPDPLLSKWHSLRAESDGEEHPLTLLTGEEVSCCGEDGGNKHLLCIGNTDFISGSGDSGENGLGRMSEHSVQKVVDGCLSSGGIACASHPFETNGIMERLLLKRKKWTDNDIRAEGLTAVQFYNGLRDKGYHKGKKKWIELLLEGRRIYTYGGNDSHGDMNRRRKIAIPLFTMGEDSSHLLGHVRTVVHSESSAGDDLLNGLRQGHAFVTDGPFIDLKLVTNNTEYRPGETVPPGTYDIIAECRSSAEFGAIISVEFFTGRTGEPSEIRQSSVLTGEMVCTEVIICVLPAESYIRAELRTDQGAIALTNPLWIN